MQPAEGEAAHRDGESRRATTMIMISQWKASVCVLTILLPAHRTAVLISYMIDYILHNIRCDIFSHLSLSPQPAHGRAKARDDER